MQLSSSCKSLCGPELLLTLNALGCTHHNLNAIRTQPRSTTRSVNVQQIRSIPGSATTTRSFCKPCLSKIFRGAPRLPFPYANRPCRPRDLPLGHSDGMSREIFHSLGSGTQKKFIWKTLERRKASCYCPRIIVIAFVTNTWTVGRTSACSCFIITHGPEIAASL